jgi:hypothetical protein
LHLIAPSCAKTFSQPPLKLLIAENNTSTHHENYARIPRTCQPTSIATPHRRRPNGKVARLPERLGDLANQMLRDGFTYNAIIQKLHEHGVSLLKSNLSHWRNGGISNPSTPLRPQ